MQSPPLTDMVTNLLQISDNVLAEAVGREVAKQAGSRRQLRRWRQHRAEHPA